jgi:salicylate hydroxylase
MLADRHCTESTIPKVSAIYNTLRCGPGNDVLEKSRVSGRLLGLASPGFEDVTEGDSGVCLERLRAMMDELGENWAWLWKDSMDGSRLRALEMLAEGFER